MNIALELNRTNELSLAENSKNIISGITNAFEKSIEKGIDLLSLPDGFGEKIKEGIKDFDYGGLITDVTSIAIKQGMKKIGLKTSSFEDLVQIKDAIKEGNLKKGLSNVLDIVIDNIKLIPENIKELVKVGKDRILGTTFEKELDAVMKKQKSALTRINNNCDKFEKALLERDDKNIDKLEAKIKEDLNKIMPIESVITRARQLLNQNELMKNKQNSLTAEEIELCKKIG